MKAQILESEHFGNGPRNYFLDFAKASNNSNYIKITRSDKRTDGSYERSSVIVFEDDFMFLIESFSMLFTSVIHRKEKSKQKSDGRQSGSVKTPKTSQGIKSWEPEDRPREKLIEYGSDQISDAELLAMLIGSGTPEETAVDLASKIIKSNGGTLQSLSDITIGQLQKFPGIGMAKATIILAAVELSKRMAVQFKLPFKLKAV